MASILPHAHAAMAEQPQLLAGPGADRLPEPVRLREELHRGEHVRHGQTEWSANVAAFIDAPGPKVGAVVGPHPRYGDQFPDALLKLARLLGHAATSRPPTLRHE
jgi:hypothetical protein